MFIEVRIARGIPDRQSRACKALMFVVLGAFPWNTVTLGEELAVTTDLLVVGGTESGCAAAVQAARMGVQKVGKFLPVIQSVIVGPLSMVLSLTSIATNLH